jgi:hypothetical protein
LNEQEAKKVERKEYGSHKKIVENERIAPGKRQDLEINQKKNKYGQSPIE